MRKVTLLLAVMMAASFSMSADAATTKRAKAQAVKEDPNANTWKVLREGWPLVLPAAARTVYFMHKAQQEKGQPKRKPFNCYGCL